MCAGPHSPHENTLLWHMIYIPTKGFIPPTPTLQKCVEEICRCGHVGCLDYCEPTGRSLHCKDEQPRANKLSKNVKTVKKKRT